MKIIILLVCVLYVTFGFSQEVNTQNNDLRVKREIFTVKDLLHDKKIIYKLETSMSGQFTVVIEENKKIVKVKKVGTQQAQKMDDIFVDRYISLKYMMDSSNRKKCKSYYQLSLRGELLSVCEAEKEKIKIVKEFIAKFEKQCS
ncbi:MAG: hypothetical protein HON90_12945 [Halobacteriovoraceae bacterium]|jgi:hypothetical protein|nr:hypothetical protein [Halobacteriovoraceae bacterium]